MNPSRRGLLLSGRRSSRAAALTLGVLTLGAVGAPAALAVQDTGDTTAPTTAADTGSPQVLTDSPVLRLAVGEGTEASPAHFGSGKLYLSVAPEPDTLPEGATIDMSGAQIRFSYEETAAAVDNLAGDDEEATDSIVCTTDEAGDCWFDPEQDASHLYRDGVVLAPDSAFTLTQITPPSSGAFDLPSGAEAEVHGVVDGFVRLGPDPVVLDVAPDIDTSAGDEAPGPFQTTSTVTFFDPAATLASAAPATTSPDAGGTAAAAAATSAGVTAAAGTGTAPGTTSAGPQLATTGTDTLPMLAAGAGLLLAGTGAVVLGRRRTRSS